MIVLDLLLRFRGAGVDYFTGADGVVNFGKVPHIRCGIGIERILMVTKFLPQPKN
jgi:hypothetical protein